jgi:hypothetical protein
VVVFGAGVLPNRPILDLQSAPELHLLSQAITAWNEGQSEQHLPRARR